jgi:UDP-N-acetylmuramate--alanine ligase
MKNKKVHFLGIGGSGASAVAHIAENFGFEVSGCDTDSESEFLKDFKTEQLHQGHSSGHLYYQPTIIKGLLTTKLPEEKTPIDILAVTPAIFSLDPNNPELLEAKEKGIETLTWQEFMGKYLEEGKYVIAVAGTHGKSTTTAMAARILEAANLNPTAELGAIIPEWGKNYKQSLKFSQGSNYRIGKSKFFITEADEYNDNFLATHPDIAIVTNIEMDHPEYFKDFEDYKQSFLEFLYQVKSLILANLSDPGIREVMEKYQKNKDKKYNPKILDYSNTLINFSLKVFGEHNKLNATAAFQAGLHLGIDPNIIRNSLMSFTGISRRMELLGKVNEAVIFSDFGHHPTEIKTTIEALREKYPDQKMILFFEPHMFSRTKALFEDFVKVFKELPVNQIFITDIYQSREHDKGLVTSYELANKVNKPGVSYLPKKELLAFAKLMAKPDTVLVFMGAGEIDKAARQLVSM